MDSTTQHKNIKAEESLGVLERTLLYKEVDYTSSIQFSDPTGNSRLVENEWGMEF